VGNHGVNNQSEFNINASMVPGSGNAGRPLFQRFGRVGNVTSYIGTHTYYNGLQAKLDRRFSNGLMITTAYTFSKALNFSEDVGAVPIPMNLLLNKGQMSDNRRHVYTQSFLYQLPFGKGRAWGGNAFTNTVLGGWQVQGIVSLMSGTWFSATAPDALLNAPGNQQRANVVGKVKYPKLIGPGQQFFDKSAFQVPAQNTLGNAGRNILQGPRFMNLDASVFRDFRIREGMTTTFRMEAFNATNTPHYMNPTGDINSPLFGQINAAEQDQRQLQLALTFRF
jgi:hypothetical protein